MMTRPDLMHDDIAALSGEDATAVACDILLDQRTRFA
jgi:hypothetical protein